MKKISTKLINKNLSTIIIVLAFAVIGVAVLIVSFAATPQVANVAVQNATASLSLSPSSGTYNVGTTINVVVNETSSDGVASVQSDLTYDKNVLEFKSLDASNTNFDACVKKPVSGGGNVYLACASTNGPQTGPQKVATVTFQVLAASSSSTVNFASTALVKRADLSVAWAGPAPGANLTLKSSTGSSSGSGSGSSVVLVALALALHRAPALALALHLALDQGVTQIKPQMVILHKYQQDHRLRQLLQLIQLW